MDGVGISDVPSPQYQDDGGNEKIQDGKLSCEAHPEDEAVSRYSHKQCRNSVMHGSMGTEESNVNRS